MREQQVLRKPTTDIAGVLSGEYLKGEAGGIRALLALPETLIEGAESKLEQLKGPSE